MTRPPKPPAMCCATSTEAAPRHHEDEERHLFPAVLAAPDAPPCPTPARVTALALAPACTPWCAACCKTMPTCKPRWASARPVLERIARPDKAVATAGTAEETALTALPACTPASIEAENHLIYPPRSRR